MTNRPKAWLALENGLVLEGRAVGAKGEASGDLVFNTAMTGYHEILTDPSYCGQIVMMTYPLIGNYGVAEEDAESDKAWAEALIMKEMSSISSSHRSNEHLSTWLERNGVVAIEGVDTRRLTKLVRVEGSMRCFVSTEESDPEKLIAKARASQTTDGQDLASVVSCKDPYRWNSGYDESYPDEIATIEAERTRVVGLRLRCKAKYPAQLVALRLRRDRCSRLDDCGRSTNTQTRSRLPLQRPRRSRCR